MSKTMLGFDFGACELKIAQMDGSAIKRLVSVQMPDNMVHDGVIVSYDAMGDFLKETIKANKISGNSAAVILPGSFAFLRRLTMPVMTEEQLAVNLPYEFRDFLTEAKDKYFYDYAVNALIEEKSEDGTAVRKALDLTAAAVAKSTIESYRAMFRRAGLKLATAIPIECAYSNIIRAYGSDSVKEYCFLDLGHTATRLAIYTGEAFETFRATDMGLGTLDSAFSETFGVDSHVARMYKHTNHKDCQYEEVAQNVYGAIAADVRKAVNFYGFNNRESQLSDVFICGGGIHIEPFIQAIRANLELTVHKASDLIGSKANGQENVDAFIGAIGAGMQ